MVTPVTSERLSPLIVSFLPGLGEVGLTLVTTGVSPPMWNRGSPAGSSSLATTLPDSSLTDL